jgi:hypothetical protein
MHALKKYIIISHAYGSHTLRGVARTTLHTYLLDALTRIISHDSHTLARLEPLCIPACMMH